MKHPFQSLIDNVDRPYYFGIGGIGDFLLLMSTFYDDIEDGEVDVVFVANNIKPLQQLVSKPKDGEYPARDYFPKVNRFWFFPRKMFPYDPLLWDHLTNNEKLRGTGVTPRTFAYVQDWNECGKTDVFNYYGVKRELGAIRRWPPGGRNIPTVIQPFGGADDPTKVKQLSKVLLHQLVDVNLAKVPVSFIGSPADMDEMRDMNFHDRYGNPHAKIRYVTDIKEAINQIRLCNRFIGADSWGKTAAALSGLKPSFIEVFRNKYINKTPQEMFGQDTDPGDFVFLHNWGFTLLDDPEIM